MMNLKQDDTDITSVTTDVFHVDEIHYEWMRYTTKR